ncbi:MAG TPA: cobalamin biosynthesis protein CobW [Stellaceae bacterium]|nr:cobalamin biosynthesis protein CobW [Stellaceae bacterium]
MRRIPATIVTGFLGAGKTSLIRHLLTHAGGRRIALVINEFGELGIDREILLGCRVANCGADDVIELANGCICCTVAEDFLPTIERLLERPEPPEHIVIETSGLALPKPLVQAFAWPEVKARVTVDGVVAVIDAAAVVAGRFADDPAALEAQREADPALDHDNPLEEVFGDQLACADLVVLNKSDLVSGTMLRATETALRMQLRPAVKLLRTAHGAVPPDLLLGLDAGAEDDLACRPSHADLQGTHDHDDFESFVVARGPVADPQRFVQRLGAVVATHDILRLKGFLDVPGKEFRQVVQAVGARLQHYFDRPWGEREARATRLVVIGRKGLDRAAIAAALQA